MPKRSYREEIMNDLDNMLKFLIIYDEENTEQCQEVLDMYAQLSSTRFLSERETIPKSNSMMNLMWEYDDKEFKQIARMSKSSFIGLLELIEQHEVFKIESNRKQKPVWIQLMITLNRLGCEGNGSSIGRCAMFSGIGYGSVLKYQERVFIAIKDLQKQYITWPNAEQRKQISEWFNSWFAWLCGNR